MSRPEMIYLSPDTLHPDPRNPRKHPKKQINQIADSIKKFGNLSPIAVDKNGMIITGHARWLAVKQLGLTEVPVVRAEHLTPAQAKAYAIADNKLTENAEWDKKLLGEIFLDLKGQDLDFSLDITGFEMDEIQILMENVAVEAHEEETPPPEIEEKTVTELGDVWLAGEHRVHCGNSSYADSFQTVMNDEKAQMIFTDAPYNRAMKSISGLGKTKHPEFAEGAGEKSSGEFTGFLSKPMGHACQHSTNGSLHYWCMDWRHDLEIRNAALEHYAEHKATCVWVKDNGGMGSLYRSRHEFVFVFKHGTAPHINNIRLGEFGRYRTNVWEYAGYNSFARESDGEGNLLNAHPTVKPVALVADAIKDCTHQGDIVLDCFLGSGSTLIAAEKTGRRCYGIELEPRYVDVVIRRWQNLTGKSAIHAGSGLTFQEIVNQKENAHV